MVSYGGCRSCQAAIIWTVTEGGKRMPVDRKPDPQGIVLAHQDIFGTWHSRAWVAGEPVIPPWGRYTSHFATCPNANQHRKGPN